MLSSNNLKKTSTSLNMLPSMPIIFTPMKEEPSPTILVIKNTKYAPCAMPSDTSDTITFDGTKQELILPLSPEIERQLDEETTPPRENEINSGNLSSFPMKKSSPLKLVNPILKKYNSHRQGKIMKRSVSPMHSQSHISYAQTYFLHSDSFEPTSHADVDYGHVDNEADLAALMEASSTVPRTPKGRQTAPLNKKKRLKELRDAKVMLALLSPDSEQYRTENARNFAQAYYHKLQERLEENCDEELFEHILQLMGEFEAKTTPVKELYERVVSSLHRYPDLAELFNIFLLPEQAMECGKFMEYVKLTNMKTFVRKLETFFAKQPQQFRQILATMTSLSEQPDVTINDVKSAVLPLLRGNTFLIDCFLFLFPSERPPDSLMTDFEEMEVDSDDHSGDEEESVLIPDRADNYGTDNCACLCHNSDKQKYVTRHLHCFSCGTKFIHGKVYVHIGRVLRPAKVSFPGFSDDIIHQRLGVKVSRKARRKNSCSPSKTPHDGHFEEKGDTDEEPKSSSPKSCKIAKPKIISPTSKLRADGLKQSLNGCNCEADASDECIEDHLTEDHVRDSVQMNDISEVPTLADPSSTIVPSSLLTSTNTIPSSVSCNTTNTILPTFGSESPDETADVQHLTQRNILSSEIFQNDVSCDDNISIGSDIDFYTCTTTDTNMPLMETAIHNDTNNEVFSESMNDFQMAMMGATETVNVTHTSLESLQSFEFTKNLETSIPLRADTPDLLQDVLVSVGLPVAARNEEHESSTSMITGASAFRPSTDIAEFSGVKTESTPTKDFPSKSLLLDPYLEDPLMTCTTPTVEPSMLTSTLLESSDLENCHTNTTSINSASKSPSMISSIHGDDSATLTDYKHDSLLSTVQTNVFSPMGLNYDSLTFSAQMNNSSTSNDCFSITGMTNDTPILLGSTTDCLTFLEQMSDSSMSASQNNDCFKTNEPSPTTSLNNDCLTLSIQNSFPFGTGENDLQTSASHWSDEAKLSPRPWTREEDRLILVEVQLGLGMEETFVNIRKGLPLREMDEIRARFHMLMKILQEMTDPKEDKKKTTACTPSTSATL